MRTYRMLDRLCEHLRRGSRESNAAWLALASTRFEQREIGVCVYTCRLGHGEVSNNILPGLQRRQPIEKTIESVGKFSDIAETLAALIGKERHRGCGDPICAQFSPKRVQPVPVVPGENRNIAGQRFLIGQSLCFVLAQENHGPRSLEQSAIRNMIVFFVPDSCKSAAASF